jgi:hypothetical protein
MELNERLERFIKSRIKDTVSDSMFDKMVAEEISLDVTEGRAGEINESIDRLTNVIVETLMENKIWQKH